MYAIIFEGRLFLTPAYKINKGFIEIEKYIEIKPLFELKIEELKSFANKSFSYLTDINTGYNIIDRPGTHIINLNHDKENKSHLR